MEGNKWEGWRDITLRPSRCVPTETGGGALWIGGINLLSRAYKCTIKIDV